jgi:hypothetical protein
MAAADEPFVWQWLDLLPTATGRLLAPEPPKTLTGGDEVHRRATGNVANEDVLAVRQSLHDASGHLKVLRGTVWRRTTSRLGYAFAIIT